MRDFIEATTPYKVREADNDVSVIHEATENHCDVILLNLSMPLQDSLVTVSLLRSRLPHVKIIGFSTFSVDLGNRVPPETGFETVLTNQDGLSELVATLKALMPEPLREMASAFDMQKIGYALEKISDFILGSGSGHRGPGWADTSTRVIVEGLRAFEEKVREHGTAADEINHHLGTAIYATCQLQSYVTGEDSDIANRNAAWVYRDFLLVKIEELLRLEQSLDFGEGQQ